MIPHLLLEPLKLVEHQFGDSTGTLFGDRLTPYPSGELVVQTANAAFALIYLGSSDSNNQIGIPTSVQVGY